MLNICININNSSPPVFFKIYATPRSKKYNNVCWSFRLYIPLCFRVPKTTLRFNDFLKRLIELRKVLCSWLKFITTKEHRLKSVNAKGTEGRVQKRPDTSFQLRLPIDLYKQHLIFPIVMYNNMHGVSPNRKTQPRLCVQDFYQELVTQSWNTHVIFLN